jgi:DNA-binding NarL/FixJ family response regulator
MAEILLATSSSEDRSRIGELLAENAEWRCHEASTAEEALSALEPGGRAFDILLTDARFDDAPPEEFLVRVRARRPFLPVVLVASVGADEAVVRALQLGAASYVPRSAMARDLASTVARLLSLCGTSEAPAGILARRIESQSTFELSNDARLFPPLVAYVQDELQRFGLVGGDERVLVSVAIEEALVNGMIHGNLEIEASDRDAGFRVFEALVEERRQSSPYRNRRLYVTVRMTPTEGSITIRDEGKGFDVASVPDPRAPENRSRSRGRGLLLMRTFMDEVAFNAAGNEVRLVKRRKAGTETV